MGAGAVCSCSRACIQPVTQGHTVTRDPGVAMATFDYVSPRVASLERRLLLSIRRDPLRDASRVEICGKVSHLPRDVEFEEAARCAHGLCRASEHWATIDGEIVGYVVSRIERNGF